ncbi:cache domain-containing sensor histidine kinase [Paenibacillus daejeonensis]|uniref:cache domain-containing sensor histidine kinase n=1 Tax=Paenibacillus daejeonensis TaxID=135193 RepID=UPI00036641FA|nr:histidine kinase [Paenibacillus daejeonensis]
MSVKPWHWSRSFRFRLMITSVVCLLVPAFITLALYNMLTKDAVKEEAMTQSRQKLQLVEGYVSNLLDYMLYIVNTVQHDSEMSRVLKEIAAGKLYEGANAEYEKYTDWMRIINKIEHMTVYGDKAYVTILLTDGSTFTNYSTDEYAPNNLRQEPWFEDLNQLKGVQSLWLGTSPTVFPNDRRSSPYQISMARTLRSGITPYGYVVVTIMERQVSTIFNRLAEGQETMLLDGEGRILSHLNGERIGQTFTPSGSAAPVSEIVELEEGSAILTRQPHTVTGWELVSLTPYKAAVFQLNAIFNRIAVLQLVSFVVFLLLFLYLLGSFTRPLVRLGKVAETVQRGNLEVRSHIRGHDEIGYLGSSFDLMLEHIKEMLAEVMRTQSRKRKAELAMLQAQINPHFLFNVLNSIRMKVMRKGDMDSAEMISSLSKLLRMTIIQDKGMIPLHEELSMAAAYVKLMNMRQKEETELALDISPEVLMLPVPRFFIQPLIENAIIHGLHQRVGIIAITAVSEKRRCIIAVRDNGQGMDESTLQTLQDKLAWRGERPEPPDQTSGRFSGIGVANVCERMRLAYGEEFGVQAVSHPGKGTTITMSIPKAEVEENDVYSHAGG